MDIKEIQNLIKFVAKSGVAEVKYKTKDYEINIKSTGTYSEPIAYAPQPIAPQHVTNASATSQPTQGDGAQPEAAADEDSKYVAIKSPMIGTFYRKTSPDKPVLVNVGDTIKVGDPVCVIEAMKLFNEIEAEISGKIVKILADDATPVEYDQPLFLVDPS